MTQFKVFLTAAATKEIKTLPGNIRQRVRRAIDALKETPRPAFSQELEQGHTTNETRPIRIEDWRIVYLVSDDEATIDVLGVRKRPPYDYSDLAKLLQDR